MYEIALDRESNKCTLRVTKGMKIESLKELSVFMNSCVFEIEQVDRISLEQMKLIWALCGELGDILGDEAEEMREILQHEFCNKREINWFSISPYKKDCATSEIAAEFIQFIIEWSIEQGYNIRVPEGNGNKKILRNIRDVVPDIQRFVIANLRAKRCAVCGTYENVDLDHYDPIGSRGYESDDGLQTRFISLCRKHHNMKHNMTKKEFEGKWHLTGVWLTENLVRNLKKVYKGHFKAFKESEEN